MLAFFKFIAEYFAPLSPISSSTDHTKVILFFNSLGFILFNDKIKAAHPTLSSKLLPVTLFSFNLIISLGIVILVSPIITPASNASLLDKNPAFTFNGKFDFLFFEVK